MIINMDFFQPIFPSISSRLGCNIVLSRPRSEVQASGAGPRPPSVIG